VKGRLLSSLRAEPCGGQEKHYRGEKKRAELLCLLSKHLFSSCEVKFTTG
jgi:hypothetical protein